MYRKKLSPPPMKRTASMKGITTTTTIPDYEDPNPHNPSVIVRMDDHDHYFSSFLSPRYYNSTGNSAINSRLQNQTSLPFLTTCGLCNRRLSHGHDIYMYRGDTAFCSQECREQQIEVDERKDKRAAASKNVDSHRNHPEMAASAAGSESTGKGETIAAA